MRVHVSASEGFTGNLLLAGRRFILRGTFDDTGEFMHTESTFYYDEDSDPVNGDVAITLTHNPGETTLGITVDFGGNSADETIPASPTSTELTGPYALVLPVESASARRHRGPRRVTGGSLPGARPATLGGVGSGYFKMESNATTRIVLRLADGLTASFGGALVTADVLPVFVNLYPQRHSSPPDPGGFFGGFLTFRKVAHVSDGDGDFHWTRPTRGGASVFDAGFAIIQPVKVVKYIPFHETRPPLRIYVDPPENATIALSGGGLLNDEFVPGDFGPSHVDAPVLRLSLDAAWRTGLCIGKFLHPALGRDVPMQGVIDRKGARIIGAFFTPAGSGTFSIEAKLGDVDP